MTASQQDIIIEQGATMLTLWEIQNKDLTAGYTFAAKFRTQHSGGTEVLALSSAGGTLTVVKSGSHTHVTANVAATSTDDLAAPAMLVYDLEYTQTSTGVVTRAFEGAAFVTPEATK